MIIDSLKSFEKYLNIHPSFQKVYDFISGTDLHKLELGKHIIEENNLWCKVTQQEGKSFDDLPKLEVHDSFIDIHILLTGSEIIGFRDRVKCSGVEAKYDEMNDIAFLDEEAEVFVNCGVDNFVICFPKDAHSPMIGDGIIRKAIIKVRV